MMSFPDGGLINERRLPAYSQALRRLRPVELHRFRAEWWPGFSMTTSFHVQIVVENATLYSVLSHLTLC